LGSEKASEGTCELEAGLVEMKVNQHALTAKYSHVSDRLSMNWDLIHESKIYTKGMGSGSNR
jgi:hypothetical protein